MRPAPCALSNAPAEIVRNLATQRHCLATLSYDVGDPQTYALLHCSVFKERTRGVSVTRCGSYFRPRQAPGRLSHDGYNIAAVYPCQARNRTILLPDKCRHHRATRLVGYHTPTLIASSLPDLSTFSPLDRFFVRLRIP